MEEISTPPMIALNVLTELNRSTYGEASAKLESILVLLCWTADAGWNMPV